MRPSLTYVCFHTNEVSRLISSPLPSLFMESPLPSSVISSWPDYCLGDVLFQPNSSGEDRDAAALFMFSSTSLPAQQQENSTPPSDPPATRRLPLLLLPSPTRRPISLLSSPTLGISIVLLTHPRNHKNNTNEYTLTPVPFHSGTDPSIRPLPAVHDLDFRSWLSSHSQPHPPFHF